MFGGPLHTGRQHQRFGFAQAVGGDLCHNEPPLGEGAGLVQCDKADVPSPLEGFPVTDQDAVLGRNLGGIHGDERDGEAKSVGASDHQHRDCTSNREGDAGGAEEPPGEEGWDRDPDGDDHQPKGGPVGQHLKAAARRLGLLDQSHDLGESGRFAGAGHEQGQGAFAVYRSRHHLIALLLGHRPGFAGEERFVHRRDPLDNVAVHRDLLARANQDPIAISHRLHWDIFDRPVAGDPVGDGRDHIRQVLESPAGRLDRPHLHPVTQQHHVQERGQLPVEVVPLDTQ